MRPKCVDEITLSVAALKGGAGDYVVKRPGYLERLSVTLEVALEHYLTGVARQVQPLRVLYAELDQVTSCLLKNLGFLYQLPRKLEFAKARETSSVERAPCERAKRGIGQCSNSRQQEFARRTRRAEGSSA